MISIVIPAHNEETVIARCLNALTDGHEPGELEIIVCCNGCKDATGQIARSFGPPVRVLETDVPSKANALNLADEVATGFPRIYLDADVIMSLQSIRELAKALEAPGILAVAPAVRTIHPPGTSWSVRAYYDFWMALPYIQEGMMAAGAYGMNRDGRARFDRFPLIISDDGYVRLQFNPSERIEVKSALSEVSAPRTFADLVKIKTRSRLGVHELMTKYPENYRAEFQTKNYGGAVASLVRRPDLYAAAIPYLLVTLIARYRAKKQFDAQMPYVWERDNSSRAAAKDQ